LLSVYLPDWGKNRIFATQTPENDDDENNIDHNCVVAHGAAGTGKRTKVL
jgi:hypothetical protein